MLTKSALYNQLTSAGVILILAIIYAINVGILGDAEASVVGEGSLFVERLRMVEGASPTLAHIVAICLIVAGAVVTTMTAINHNMHGVTTHLPSMVYLALFAALSRPGELIAPPLAALFIALSIRCLYDVYGHLDLTHKLFNGIFLLGLLPLIYPSMIILAPLIIVAFVVFERSGREITVVTAAFFIPMLLYIYIMWLFGVGIDQQLGRFSEIFFSEGESIRSVASSMIIFLLMVPTAIYVIRNIDDLSITLMSRKRTFYSVLLFFSVLLLLFVPSFTLSQLLIAAAPISIFTITAIAVSSERWAHYIYLLLILLITFVGFIPI